MPILIPHASETSNTIPFHHQYRVRRARPNVTPLSSAPTTSRERMKCRQLSCSTASLALALFVGGHLFWSPVAAVNVRGSNQFRQSSQTDDDYYTTPAKVDDYADPAGNEIAPMEGEVAPMEGEVAPMEGEVAPMSTSENDGESYSLRQYTGTYCSGSYVALELNLNRMNHLTLPSGTISCNRLKENASSTVSFMVNSCPGDASGSCPATCDCREDLTKHFTIDKCNGGWMLVKGESPTDCGQGNDECRGKNNVDVGLARWCVKWPSGPQYRAKDADEVSDHGDSTRLS